MAMYAMVKALALALLAVGASAAPTRFPTASRACAAGKWKSGNYCYNCPSGRWSNLAGRTSYTQCRACGMGRYNQNSGATRSNFCRACPRGRYTQYTGRNTVNWCRVCPRGRYTQYTARTRLNQCSYCPSGKTTVSNNNAVYRDQKSDCNQKQKSCPAGQWASGNYCYNCPGGRWSNLAGRTSYLQCRYCGAGRYSMAYGQTRASACKVCQRGRWTQSASTFSCYACPMGKTTHPSNNVAYRNQRSDCSYNANGCPAGFWRSRNYCYTCPSGRWSNSRGLSTFYQCRVCARGRYSQYYGQTSASACKVCQKGKYNQFTGRYSCYFCPAGKTTVTNSNAVYRDQRSDCSISGACPAGYWKSGNSCRACPAGRYTQYKGRTRLSQCTYCPRGRYTQYGARTTVNWCYVCPRGRYTQFAGRTRLNQCSYCPSGKTTVTNNNAVYRDQRSDCRLNAKVCAAGKWGPSGYNYCYNCPTGRWSSASGRISYLQCVSCPRGKYSTTYGSTRANTCRICPKGRYNQYTGRWTVNLCYYCPKGRTTSSNNNAAYRDQRSDCSVTTAVVCHTGQYRYGANQCRSCPAGRYNQYRGRTSINQCTVCPRGHYTQYAGRTTVNQCYSCPYGKTTSANNNAIYRDNRLDCAYNAKICGKGTYSNGHTNACYNCPPGRWQAYTGRTRINQCYICPTGRYTQFSKRTNYNQCTWCPAGKTTSSSNNAAYRNQRSDCRLNAKKCGLGKWASGNRCYSCPRGRYSQSNGLISYMQCRTCPKGRYNQYSGQTRANACRVCARGKWNAYAGSGYFCYSCPRGRYTQYTGRTNWNQCSYCPTGKTTSANNNAVYRDQRADCNMNAKSCPAGKWTNSNYCYNCPSGRYSQFTGRIHYTQCRACGKGRYNQGYGSTRVNQCKTCPRGRWTQYAATYRCYNCPTGKTNSANNNAVYRDQITDCNVGASCPAGQWKSGNACYSCPAGRYGYYSGRTRINQCSRCSAGRYNQYSGRTRVNQCTVCPTGRYTQFSGRSTYNQCSMCPSGKTTSANANAVYRNQVSDCNVKLAMGCTFDSRTGYSDSTSGITACGWTQGGYKKWTTNRRTGSSSTGAQQAADKSGYFAFLETSVPSAKGWVSTLQSSKLKGAYLQIAFKYHMHGSTMGAITLQAYANNRWTPVGSKGLWYKSGQQHKLWASAWSSSGAIILPKGTTYVRWYAVAGAPWYSDFSIDSVVIKGRSAKSCAAGKWLSGNACRGCAAGRYSRSVGLNRANQCRVCGRGTYSTGSAMACRVCTRGRYTQYTGRSRANQCAACPSGKTNSANNNAVYRDQRGDCSMLSCGAGKWISGTKCQNCPPGRWSSRTGLTTFNQCYACPSGRYNQFGARTRQNQCRVCSTGRYTQFAARTSLSQCSVCPRGRYNQYTARNRVGWCRACPKGKTTKVAANAGNRNQLSDCSMKDFGGCGFDASSCGYGVSTGPAPVINRWFRTHSSTSHATGATKPQSGRYYIYFDASAPAGTGSTGYLWSKMLGADLGHRYLKVSFWYHMHGSSIGSAALQVQVGSSWRQVWVKRGEQQKSWHDGWRRAIVFLPTNTRRLRFKAVVGDGHLGDVCFDTIVLSERPSTKCIAGQYRSGNTCKSCPQGKFSELTGRTRVTQCRTCAAGTYASSAGAYACSVCPIARYTTGRGRTRVAQCSACPKGKTTWVGDYRTNRDQKSDCKVTACAAGKWKNKNVCFACGAGRWSAAGLSVNSCIACAAGRYSTKGGQTRANQCRVCPAGRFGATAGAVRLNQCTVCARGRYTQFSGRSAGNQCSSCPKGRTTVTNANAAYRNSRGDCNVVDRGACSFDPCSRTKCNNWCGWSQSGRKMWKLGTRTGSAGTGATKAQAGAGFVHLETSTPSKTGWVSYLNSRTLSGTNQLSFWYHMHGATIGSLAVEVKVGSTWRTMWKKVGQQQGRQANGWRRSGVIYLPTGTKQARFVGTAGASWTGDVSIDTLDLVSRSSAVCAAGEYKSGNSCRACPAGRYTQFAGRTRAAQCRACGAGTYASAGSPSCLTCARGRYTQFSSRSTANQCTACPKGRTNSARSAAAYRNQKSDCYVGCDVGQYRSGNYCYNCPRGRYSGLPGRTRWTQCVACGRGRYQTALGATTANQCRICRRGRYTQYTARWTANQCAACPSGRTNAPSNNAVYRDQRTDCFYAASCAAGTYKSGNYCRSCPQGRYRQSGGATRVNQCTSCAPGRYNQYTRRNRVNWCRMCPSGRYQTKSAATRINQCTYCPRGKTTKLGDKYNHPIYRSHKSDCSRQACGIGKFLNSKNKKCVNCPKGKYGFGTGNVQVNQCTYCPTGRYNQYTGRSRYTQCSRCPSGKTTKPRNYLTSKPSDFDNRNDCRIPLCGQGKYKNGNRCVACPRGRYNQYTGRTTVNWCRYCPRGRYTQYTSRTRLNQCARCPSGKTNHPTSTVAHRDQSSDCSYVSCAAGKWQSGNRCYNCPRGRYNQYTARNRVNWCRVCPRGRWTQYSGRSRVNQCAYCPSGRTTYSTNNAVYRDQRSDCRYASATCVPGQYRSGNSCRTCPKGRYQPYGTPRRYNACFACPTGRYGTRTGRTSYNQCTACGKGRYNQYSARTSANWCRVCPRGRWNQYAAFRTCYYCPRGRTTSASTSTVYRDQRSDCNMKGQPTKAPTRRPTRRPTRSTVKTRKPTQYPTNHVSGIKFKEVGKGYCREKDCATCASSHATAVTGCVPKGARGKTMCLSQCKGNCKGVAYAANPRDNFDNCRAMGMSRCNVYQDHFRVVDGVYSSKPDYTCYANYDPHDKVIACPAINNNAATWTTSNKGGNGPVGKKFKAATCQAQYASLDIDNVRRKVKIPGRAQVPFIFHSHQRATGVPRNVQIRANNGRWFEATCDEACACLCAQCEFSARCGRKKCHSFDFRAANGECRMLKEYKGARVTSMQHLTSVQQHHWVRTKALPTKSPTKGTPTKRPTSKNRKPLCAGDFDGNRKVDAKDLLKLLSMPYFATGKGSGKTKGGICQGDLSQDGELSVKDVLNLLVVFGHTYDAKPGCRAC